MGDIEADFGDMDEGKAPRSRERDETGKFKPKAAEAKVEKPVAKAPEAPVEDEKPAAKPEEQASESAEDKKPTRMRDLGQRYDDLKKKISTEYEPTIQKLKYKVQELETRKPEDPAPVLAKMTALEKRNQELEQHMTYVDYSQSTDFKTKYSQPYSEAWTDAVAEFRQLRVREAAGTDEVTGDPKFTARAADENDLLKLANMSLADMDEAATSMFGPSASRAIGHLQNIRKLSAAQNKALEDARTKSAEWKSQQTLEFQHRQQNANKTWAEINKSLEERFPKAFKVEEADADDKASHTKGFALADLLFLGNNALTPEQIEALPAGFRETLKEKKPLSEVQKVQLHALARLKMANHDRLVKRIVKKDARIAELEKSLAEFEESEPAAGKAGDGERTSTKSWDDQVADDLAKLDK